jgi:hypothetical protein
MKKRTIIGEDLFMLPVTDVAGLNAAAGKDQDLA